MPKMQGKYYSGIYISIADNAGQFTSLDGSGGWITKLDSRKIISVRGADS